MGLVAVRAAGNQLHLRTNAAPVRGFVYKTRHRAGVFPVIEGVALSGIGSAPAPALVPDAPVFHAERFRAPVRGPLQRKGRRFRAVAVLRPFHRLGHAAPEHIDVDPRLCAGFPAQADKLMGAEPVFLGLPGREVAVPGRGPLRPHAVAPVVHVRIAAARPADDRRAQALQRVQDVSADSILVRNRGIAPDPDPVGNAAAEKFDKLAVEFGGDHAASGLGKNPYPVHCRTTLCSRAGMSVFQNR